MALNIQPAIDFVKKTGASIKEKLAPTCKRISEAYAEYDISITKSTHLTPNDTDEDGNEANVVNETCNTKLKFTLKDALCALAVVAVICSLVRSICSSCDD